MEYKTLQELLEEQGVGINIVNNKARFVLKGTNRAYVPLDCLEKIRKELKFRFLKGTVVSNKDIEKIIDEVIDNV